MTKQVIQIGNLPNDRTGDPLRTAFTKTNSNFTELYNELANVYNVPADKVLVVNNTTQTDPETDGAMHVLGGVKIEKALTVNDMLHVGNGADSNVFTSPAIVARRAGSSYTQIANINTDGHGSADIVAYADNGTEEGGWIDMGIAGSVFDDPAYTITDFGDGYVFVQGVDDGISHGELILCTGTQGIHKDIVFGTGGFMRENTRMTLDHGLQALEIFMTTEANAETQGALHVYGGTQVDKNLIVLGEMFLGEGGSTASLENTIFSARKNSPTYITFGVINSNNSGSADIIAQANSGTPEYGWVDMGFCGSTFADPNFTLTGPGDAYLFGAGFGDGTSDGNLVFATGTYGNKLDLVFATGGFLAENERMRYIHSSNTLNINDNIKVGGKTVKGIGSATQTSTIIDVTKSIVTVEPTNTSGSAYTVPDGVEGQILHLVPSGVFATGEYTHIDFAHARWSYNQQINEGSASYWLPFYNVSQPWMASTVITLVFTNGHWNLPHSNFD